MVDANKEILFTITVEYINLMHQLKPEPNAVPLSIEALTKIYIELEFPKRFQIFQTFMPSYVEIPKINPPYSSSKFPEGSRHVISMLSFILGYFTDENTDESILGFLSTFVPSQTPLIIYNYAEYIADSIHDQLVKLCTKGFFIYTSFFFHMFLYFQEDKFPIALQKLDVEGNPL